MQVTGKTRIFKDEYGGNTFYNTTVSRKLEDGSYKNMKVAVQFKMGEATEGDIEITNGFLSFFEDKKRNAKNKISNIRIYKGGRRSTSILSE